MDQSLKVTRNQLAAVFRDHDLVKKVETLFERVEQLSVCPLPVGSVYVQLPGQGAPDVVLGGTWLNVTSLYAGLFFRAEGGDSLAFDAGTQGHAMQDHNHVFYPGIITTGAGGGSATYPRLDTAPTSERLNSDASNVVRGVKTGSAGAVVQGSTETRPVNQSIRIWKRSA